MSTVYTVKIWCSRFDKIVGNAQLEHIPRKGELLLFQNNKYVVIEVLYSLKENGEGFHWISLDVDWP